MDMNGTLLVTNDDSLDMVVTCDVVLMLTGSSIVLAYHSLMTVEH